ncbi:citrate synthase [Miltoncostaea marina]|uniref:citrate synthase n=1 Tax=Miltoncostaea marina TaxID=2843215 RepID=UPI001C3D98AE|nr:citrate synthase [Miltoncostaea marina]
MTADEYLSAGEAAARLGVSKATLYAYVSRGLIESAPGPGPSRARRYPASSIDAFAGRRERARDRELAAHGSLHWGLPVLDSELTLIQDGRVFLRGRDVVALSRSEPFERVAALLWAADPDVAASLFAPAGDGAGPPAGDAPAAGPPSAGALAAHLVAAGEGALLTLGAGDAVVWRAAARLVEGLFGAAGARGGGRLAQRLAAGWGVADAAGELDAALVLCADHDLNVSSFTARCVASADAALEHVVLAALCALRGRRHGGLTDRVEALVRAAAHDGAAAAAGRALEGDGRLPGFGHPLHPGGDPRAAELLRLARGRSTAPDPAVEGLVALAAEQLGEAPTLDFGLAALARALGLPSGAAFALFALGRSAGWIAHALETRDDARLIRPRSRYRGPAPVG